MNHTLLTLRLIWAAMLLGQVAMGGVIMLLGPETVQQAGSWPPANLDVAQLRVYLLAVLLVGAVVCHVVRMQTYKRYWRHDRVDPRGYLRGNLPLLVFLDLAAIAAIVLYALDPSMPATLTPALVAEMLLIANFPTGAPMRPAPPRHG